MGSTSSPIGMPPCFSVSEARAVINQSLDMAVPMIDIMGEIANYKINHDRWVFFDLKDQDTVLSCFMPLANLRMAIENGMQVKVRVKPQITKFGRFSLTVQAIKPFGEGALKRAFELLKQKLTQEGLFDDARKRPLPVLPHHIGVISSVDAAGYKDFIKIVGERMGGLQIDVISTQVQGETAAEQIAAAVRQFNQLPELPEVLCILRGGGSREDLAVFDDEALVRAVAASRIPVMSGVGHEIDVTLIDLVADRRASTPSNAAELLVPDRRELLAQMTNDIAAITDALAASSIRWRERLQALIGGLCQGVDAALRASKSDVQTSLWQLNQQIKFQLDGVEATIASSVAMLVQQMMNQLKHKQLQYQSLQATLLAYDPKAVLGRGYAILWQGKHLLRAPCKGDTVTAETAKQLITMEVKDVRDKIN